MNGAVFWLFFIAVIMYALATVIFTVNLLSTKRQLARSGLVVFSVAFALHSLSFLGLFTSSEATPHFNSWQALQILVLLIGMTFLLISYRYGVHVLGFLSSPFCFIASLSVMAFNERAANAGPTILESNWFPLHLGAVLTGYALLIMAAVVALTYLLQERLLSTKNIGPMFRKLPSLNLLDEVAHRMLTIGWVSLTLGMAAGSFYAKLRWNSYWSWDPKQTWTLLTWLFISGILHMRYIVGWKGRKTMALMVVIVLLLLFSMFFLNVFFDGRHGGTYL